MRSSNPTSALAALLLVCAACNVPSATFTPGNADGGGDDDGGGGELSLVVSGAQLDVGEGTTNTFTVGLSTAPSGLVTVSVVSSEPSIASVTPATLVFDSADPKTVTVAGQPDDNTNDAMARIDLSSAEAGNAMVDITVVDDDDLAIVAAPLSVEVTEESTTTLNVTLNVAPPATVTVAVSAPDSAMATISTSTLTFTTTDWNDPHPITITGTNDNNTTDEQTSLTLSSPPLNDVTIPITVVDNDQVSISPSTTNLGTIVEQATKSFTVVLTQQPPADLTVAVTPSDTGAISVSTATLGFTTANWNVPQTVTVTALNDDDAVDETPTISLSSTGLTTRTVAMTVDDNDTLGIATDVTSLTVAELGNGTGTFKVRLTAQPTANVAVTIDPSVAGAVMLSATSLTFTPANWNTYQAITVTAVSDDDAADDVLDVTCSSVGLASKVVAVTVEDDEVLAIMTNPATAIAVTEGSTAPLQVKLTAQPVASTTINVSSGDSAVSPSPTSLTFTTSNWNTFQAVTLTGVQDDSDVIDESVAVTLSATGLPTKTVTANVTDNDPQVIVAAQASLNLNEGGAGTISVTLARQPASNVVVSVASNKPSAASVSTSSLTFTTSNWNVAQSVTVTAVEDNTDFTHDTATISFTSSGVTSDSTSVSVHDNDLINVTPTGISTCVNTTDVTVSVKLNGPPLSTTTVTLTENSSAFSINASSLTFTTGNWFTVQTFKVNGGQAGSGSITLSAPNQTSRVVNVSVASGFCAN